MTQIPPNHPPLASRELEYKAQVAQAGLISGDGAFSKKRHRLREETFDVSEAARGRGIGQALVQGALAWFVEQGAQRASVITQGRNIAAQRLYQRCGFTTSAVQLWYHRWFARDRPPDSLPD